MAKLNLHLTKLSSGYLFPEIERRARAYLKEEQLNLGIGDITSPLTPTLVQALKEASLEMGRSSTFRGYGPSIGYSFLRDKIAEHDYRHEIAPTEIFISDGAKNDLANLQELFCVSSRVALADPVYPVYVDSNVMAGRTGPSLATGGYEGLLYLPATEENGFEVEPPKEFVDLVYLCSPNNPTGIAFQKKTLEKWVEYAHRSQAILIFDAAYEAYITDPRLPRSIYEIPGAKEVAVEVRSFSKTAGFTGLRCSYTVIPHAIQIGGHSLNALWKRRHETKFGGVPYPVQRCAESVYSPQGKEEIKQRILTVMQGAQKFKLSLEKQHLTVYGGVNAPYLWCKTPLGVNSWDFFEELLRKVNIVSIPGAGFGHHGEGFVRFSAFAPPKVLLQAARRLSRL